MIFSLIERIWAGTMITVSSFITPSLFCLLKCFWCIFEKDMKNLLWLLYDFVMEFKGFSLFILFTKFFCVFCFWFLIYLSKMLQIQLKIIFALFWQFSPFKTQIKRVDSAPPSIKCACNCTEASRGVAANKAIKSHKLRCYNKP